MKSDQEGDIFAQAIEIDDLKERNDLVRQACGDDAALVARIFALIEAHSDARSMFGTEPSSSLETFADDIGPGDIVGKYKILEKIAEGGMGVVFAAEQMEPIRRRVALKIIKLGMDTKQVVARFEAERVALSLMQHPNIATVLDCGATESGRPYFVMELVNGIPITSYCDKNKLTTRERLELFIPVCQAIQHAHHKGIIHRDIKPSNVLVAEIDGSPVPKVIDFGVAKATCQQLTAMTLFTNYGQMIGTPAYMSPEQAEGSQIDVDTRSDVYSLGVLLYELLTGSQPFPEKRLRSAGWREMQRIIQEEEPPRPSNVIKNSTRAEQSRLATTHPESTKRLNQLLRRELDWIIMRCLEKNRKRRYNAASDLSNDVNNYLGNRPVTARPRTTTYRVVKFISRNKIACGFSLVLLVILVVFTQEMLYRQQARSDILIERMQATSDGKIASFVINSMFADVAATTNGEPLPAVEILHSAAKAIPQFTRFGADTNAIDLCQALGSAYYNLGYFDEATELYERAAGQSEVIYGRNSSETLGALLVFGSVCMHGSNPEKATRVLNEAVEISQTLHGDQHPLVMSELRSLARSYLKSGDTNSSIDTYERILEIHELNVDSELAQLVGYDSMVKLSKIYHNQIQYEPAEELLRRALDGFLQSDRYEFRVNRTRVFLGETLFKRGETAEAISELEGGFHGLDKMIFKYPLDQTIELQRTAAELLIKIHGESEDAISELAWQQRLNDLETTPSDGE